MLQNLPRTCPGGAMRTEDVGQGASVDCDEQLPTRSDCRGAAAPGVHAAGRRPSQTFLGVNRAESAAERGTHPQLGSDLPEGFDPSSAKHWHRSHVSGTFLLTLRERLWRRRGATGTSPAWRRRPVRASAKPAPHSDDGVEADEVSGFSRRSYSMLRSSPRPQSRSSKIKGRGGNARL